MKRIKKSLILLLSSLLIFTLYACNNTQSDSNIIKNDNVQSSSNTETNTTQDNSNTETNENTQSTITSIEQLVNTDNFRNGALEHILEGEVNKRGKAVGYHYEGLENTPGEVIEGTRSTPNEDGVYTAKVEVDGITKTSNGGKSSFFPESWSAQDVVDNINEAYENKIFIQGTDNTYRGECDEGVEIEMYIDNNSGKIISAFPIY